MASSYSGLFEKSLMNPLIKKVYVIHYMHVNVELRRPQKHLITQGWNYTSS